MLIRPNRLLLPGSPQWCDLPRPGGRSLAWRRLLSGRSGNTRLQPGACCGGCFLGCQWCCGPTVVVQASPAGTTATQAAFTSGGQVTGFGGTYPGFNGSGYVSGHTYTVTVGASPTGGTNATATAVGNSDGSVTLSVTNPGSGYYDDLPTPSSYAATLTCTSGTFGPFTLAKLVNNSSNPTSHCVYRYSGTIDVPGADGCADSPNTPIIITYDAQTREASITIGVHTGSGVSGWSCPSNLICGVGHVCGSDCSHQCLCVFGQCAGTSTACGSMDFNIGQLPACSGRPYSGSASTTVPAPAVDNNTCLGGLWQFAGGTCAGWGGYSGNCTDGPSIAITISES